MKELTLKEVRDLEVRYGCGHELADSLRMLRERMEKEGPYYKGLAHDVFRRDGGQWVCTAANADEATRIADALNAAEGK